MRESPIYISIKKSIPIVKKLKTCFLLCDFLTTVPAGIHRGRPYYRGVEDKFLYGLRAMVSGSTQNNGAV